MYCIRTLRGRGILCQKAVASPRAVTREIAGSIHGARHERKPDITSAPSTTTIYDAHARAVARMNYCYWRITGRAAKDIRNYRWEALSTSARANSHHHRRKVTFMLAFWSSISTRMLDNTAQAFSSRFSPTPISRNRDTPQLDKSSSGSWIAIVERSDYRN